jgi:hypothetical protein
VKKMGKRKKTKFFPVIFRIFLILGFFSLVYFYQNQDKVSAANWYNDTNFKYRIKITVLSSKVDSTSHTNFPVYVNLANLGSGFLSHIRTDGGDIRITKADGTTELPREIVPNGGSQVVEMYFKSDTLSNTANNDFYIYYGKPVATDYTENATYGAQNVWNSGFVGVWHMNEASNATRLDSTDSNNDLADNGTVPRVNGKIGYAADFTINNTEFLSKAEPTSLDINGADAKITVSAIVKPDIVSATYSIASKYNTTPTATGNRQYSLRIEGGASRICIASTGLAYSCNSGMAGGIVAGNWYQIALTSDDINYNIYRNGVQDRTSVSWTPGIFNSAAVFEVGRQSVDNGNYYDGVIDELRVSNVARSAGWLKTEYNNLFSPSTFYNVTAEELYTPPVTQDTFYTNFSEYTTGSQPSDWTEKWNVNDASSTVESGSGLGSKELRINQTNANRYIISWDDIPTSEPNIEILAKVMTHQNTDTSSGCVILRASGTTTTSTQNGYVFCISASSDEAWIAKYAAGTYSIVGSTVGFSSSPNNWYWYRFRANGTSLQAKVWAGEISDEPGNWTVERTDSSITSGGWTGVRGLSLADYPYGDYFAVGTGGKTAPSPAITAPGLTAHWKLDESSGTNASDSSGNSRNGTLTNFPSPPTWLPDNGQNNGALKFDGADDYVTVPASTLSSFAQSSVCAWVKPEILTSDGGDARTILGIKSSDTAGLRFTVNSTGKIVAVYLNGTDYSRRTVDSLLQVNQWAHICYTFDGSNLKIYFNGSNQTIEVTTSYGLGSGSLIGGRTTTAGSWNGAIDDLRVYNRALSASEIQDLYSSNSALTLYTALSANPASSAAPLNDVDLTANVTGTATGTINYTFYCNRSDSGTNITTGENAKFIGVTDNPKTVADVCDYSSAGTYTAKVIVERGTLAAEARTTVTATEAGLRGYWKLDESGGITAHDLSGNGRDGTLTSFGNPPSWLPDDGQIDGALDFDGVNNYVTISSSTLSSFAQSSVCAWIRPDDLASDVDKSRTVLNLYTSSTAGLRFGVNSSGKVFVAYMNSTDYSKRVKDTGTMVQINQWTHICYTFNGSTVNIYVNGSNQVEIESTTSYGLGGATQIGALQGTTGSWSGAVDDLRAYNRALSAAEIQNLYNPAGGSDTIAPSAIANLSLSGLTSSSITLNWASPGDDGNIGTASSYDIRYSTSQITDANWASATQATGEPQPLSSGTIQTFTIGGLNPGTLYYFAIKTLDEVPNTSGLSNVPSAITTSAGSGLAAYWMLNDGTGTAAADSSGNNHPGTLTNGPVWTTGRMGGALDFDGANDFVSFSNPLSSFSQSSACAWVWADSYTNSSSYASTFLNLYSDANNGVRFGGDLGASPYLYVSYKSGGTSYVRSTVEGVVETNKWYHLCYTFNGSSAKLYLDGAPLASVADSGWNPGAANQIGARSTVDSVVVGSWNGKLDDVRIFNRALDDAEIRNIYFQQGFSVSLKADRESGQAPLYGIDLTATVTGGNPADPINYTFYCNRSDSGTDIPPGWSRQVVGTTQTTITEIDACDYTEAGTYSAKVIVEKSGLAEEIRKTILVRDVNNVTGVWGHYNDDYTENVMNFKTAEVEQINFPVFNTVLSSRVGKASDAHVIWSGSIRAPQPGTYQFRFDTNGQTSRLNIDGAQLWWAAGDQQKSIYLTSGWHNFDLYFYISASQLNSQAQLYWTPPGGTEQIVPKENFTPKDWSDQVIVMPDKSKPAEKINYVTAGVGTADIAGSPKIKIKLSSLKGKDILEDDVWIYWIHSTDPTNLTITSSCKPTGICGGSKTIDGERIETVLGIKKTTAFAKVPASLIPASIPGTIPDEETLELTFSNMKFSEPRGLGIIIPYIDPTLPDFPGRISFRLSGASVYHTASQVFFFPLEPITTADNLRRIKPDFMYTDGETKIVSDPTTPECQEGSTCPRYRPNYMVMLSGNDTNKDSLLDKGDFTIIKDKPGSQIIVPAAFRLNTSKTLNLTAAGINTWYPEWGREGPQFDVIAPAGNYLKNLWNEESGNTNYLTDPDGAITDYNNLNDEIKVPEDSTWVAFQYYSSNFPEDGVNGSGESSYILAGGISPTQTIGTPAAPSLATAPGCPVTITITDNSDNETRFEVQRDVDEAFTSPATVYNGPNTNSDGSSPFSINDDIISESMEGTYYFRAQACNDEGECSDWSEPVSGVVESCSSPPAGTCSSLSGKASCIAPNPGDLCATGSPTEFKYEDATLTWTWKCGLDPCSMSKSSCYWKEVAP